MTDYTNGNIFKGIVNYLRANWYGTRIEDGKGKKRDTAVNPAVEDIAAVLASGRALIGPLKIINPTDQAAIQIINTGPTNQNSFVQGTNQAGQQTTLGLGLGSQGVLANALIPLEPFNIDPMIANLYYQGGNLINYTSTQQLGLTIPPEGPGTEPQQINPGFTYTGGQPYVPGWPVGGDPSGGYEGDPTVPPSNPIQPGNPGQAFNLHPIYVASALLQRGSVYEADCGITINASTRKISVKATDIQGLGLVTGSNPCDLNVNPGCGIEISGDAVCVKRSELIEANKGLKSGSGTCDIAVDVDGTTTQINSNQLSTKGDTATPTVVTATSCNAGTLSVTTSTWTFTRGVLISRS
jgi:hypothetical protein